MSKNCPKCNAKPPEIKSYADHVVEWECGSWQSTSTDCEDFNQSSICRVVYVAKLEDHIAELERQLAMLKNAHNIELITFKTNSDNVSNKIKNANG